ncbi:MAG: hypothetical protein AAB725_00170 [Patescibacteria group bacterium]
MPVLGDEDSVKMVTIDISGLTLEREEGSESWEKIYPSNHPDFAISLGDMVVANGRFGVEKGTRGIVVAINIPYERGRTSNVLSVWFKGEKSSIDMKSEDLEFEWRTPKQRK